MSPRARVKINREALRHNLHRVRQLTPHSKIMAAIKADGYGHGIIRVAEALASADAFAVATLEEAETLRAGKIEKRIVLLEGFRNREELQQLLQLNAIPVIHSEYQLELIEKLHLDQIATLSVWVKIDTGMHRLGIHPKESAIFWQRLQALSSIHFCGWMTHLANADELNDPSTPQQLQLFAETIKPFPAEEAIANSAGILGWPDSHREWVRPGLMLYGSSPFQNQSATELGLQPVMTLEAELIAIKHLEKGASIGYGATWSCPEDMQVGVISIGYGDGYPRHLPSGTPVLLNGQRVPLVGRVSMDMICVDLRSIDNAKIGDRAILWGEGLPVDEIASAAETISYEIFCQVTQRVEVVVEGE